MTTTPPPAGFTPGPWEIEPGDDGDRSVGMPGYNTSVYATPPTGSGLVADPVLICTIHAPTANPDSPDPEACGVPFGDEYANARLIAAAPDLYAALLRLVNEPGINQDDLPSVDEAIADARAALAKAGGGA